MEINTEVYQNIRGETVRRHIVDLGGSSTYSLKTRELWHLVLLSLVELGKCLSDEPPPQETEG
jgi:hypothetical protein